MSDITMKKKSFIFIKRTAVDCCIANFFCKLLGHDRLLLFYFIKGEICDIFTVINHIMTMIGHFWGFILCCLDDHVVGSFEICISIAAKYTILFFGAEQH